MKSPAYLLLAILTILFWRCEKESGFPDYTSNPLPPTPVYVPIYEPGDTSLGAACGLKATQQWRASVFCKSAFLDSSKISIKIFTYAKDGYSIREFLTFNAISKKEGERQYSFYIDPYATPMNDQVYSSYSIWTSDGDVLEDSYRLDTTDTHNKLIITKIDLPNKRVEGKFHVSYDIKEPRASPINPKEVTFSECRFWATIRD